MSLLNLCSWFQFCRPRRWTVALLISALLVPVHGWAHDDLHDLIERVSKQIHADGPRVDLLLLRANYYRLHRNFPAALEDLALAEALNPKSSEVHYQRANLFLDQERYQDCIASIAACLKIQPDYGGVYRVRARAYRKLGDYDRAEREYFRAIKARPDPEVYWARGECLRALGKIDEEVRNYEEGVKRLGNPISLVERLVDALVAARRLKQALQRVDAILKKHPQLDAWRMRRAEILEKAGDSNAAAEEYRRIVKRIDGLPSLIRAREFFGNLRRQAFAAATRLNDAASRPASAPFTLQEEE